MKKGTVDILIVHSAFAVYTLHYSRPALLCQGRLWCFFHFRKICYNILNFRLSALSLPVQNVKIHFFMFFALDDSLFSAIKYEANKGVRHS